MLTDATQPSDPSIYPILSMLPDNAFSRQAVREARSLLISGDDISSYPVFSWIHAVISECARQESLDPKDWGVYQTGGGYIIAHQGFLRIQDDYPDLEKRREGGNPILDWNAEEAVKALAEYQERKAQFRLRHQALYATALDALDEQSRRIIAKTAELFPYLLKAPTEDTIIVCIPWYTDNKLLWNEIGIGEEYLERVPSWAKIHEIGVILASRIFREVGHRGHDYFAYAGNYAKGDVDGMVERLLLTAQHEGSHGITDKVITYLLGIDIYNPIGEGIAGALGEDGRGYEYTEFTLRNLLHYLDPADAASRKEISYIAGSKFWCAILEVLQNRGRTKIQIWADIFRSSLKTAVQINQDTNLDCMDGNEKIAFLLNKVIEDLHISIEELERAYESINLKD